MKKLIKLENLPKSYLVGGDVVVQEIGVVLLNKQYNPHDCFVGYNVLSKEIGIFSRKGCSLVTSLDFISIYSREYSGYTIPDFGSIQFDPNLSDLGTLDMANNKSVKLFTACDNILNIYYSSLESVRYDNVEYSFY